MADAADFSKKVSKELGLFVERKVRDLKDLSWTELLEFKERQEKLRKNKYALNKLPDKGKKVHESYHEILNEVERRNKNVDETTKMLSKLNIAEKAHEILSTYEWKAHKNTKTNTAVMDSDDEDDVDPLQVINNSTTSTTRIIRVLPPEPQLITSEDLEEIKSFTKISTDENLNSETTKIDAEIINIDVGNKLSSIKSKLQEVSEHKDCDQTQKLDQHTTYLVEKTEVQAQPAREKFKPYKTTISNVHDPEKESARKLKPYWEVTAATPPLIKHSGTKMLTLLDSVAIQENYMKKLKDLQEKESIERLAAQKERLKNSKILLPNAATLKNSKAFNLYRTNATEIEGASVNYDEGIDKKENSVLD